MISQINTKIKGLVLNSDESTEFPQPPNMEVFKDVDEFKTQDLETNYFNKTLEDSLFVIDTDFVQNEQSRNDCLNTTVKTEKKKIFEKQTKEVNSFQALQNFHFKKTNIEEKKQEDTNKEVLKDVDEFNPQDLETNYFNKTLVDSLFVIDTDFVQNEQSINDCINTTVEKEKEKIFRKQTQGMNNYQVLQNFNFKEINIEEKKEEDTISSQTNTKELVLNSDTSSEFPQSPNKEVLKDVDEFNPQDLEINYFNNTLEDSLSVIDTDFIQNEQSRNDCLNATEKTEKEKIFEKQTQGMNNFQILQNYNFKETNIEEKKQEDTMKSQTKTKIKGLVLNGDTSSELPQPPNKEVLKDVDEFNPQDLESNYFNNTLDDSLFVIDTDFVQNEQSRNDCLNATVKTEKGKIFEKQTQGVNNFQVLQNFHFKETNIEEKKQEVTMSSQTNTKESVPTTSMKKKKRIKNDKNNVLNKKKPTVTASKSTNGMILTCSLCSKEFSSNDQIRYHLSKSVIHGNEGLELWNKIKEHNKCISNSHKVMYRIKNRSSFTIEKIESFLENKLQGKELELYSDLIRDGKDMEIFSSVFQTNFTKSKQRIWKCDQCLDRKFVGNLEKYTGHFKFHQKQTISFNCELCKLNTLKYKRYMAHLRFMHFMDYKCKMCGNILRNKNLYVSHMNTVHKIEEHRCDICYKTFPKKGNLNMHIKIVHKDPTHLCSTCGKYFKTNSQLQAHISAIHSDETYKCDQCDGIYKSQIYLKNHIRDIHKKMRKRYICDICGSKAFVSRKAVDGYIRRVHNQEKNVSCDLCEKMFFDKPSLKTHMRSHSSKTNYDCHLCNKSVKTYFSLSRHIMHMHKQKAPSSQRLYNKKDSILK